LNIGQITAGSALLDCIATTQLLCRGVYITYYSILLKV